MSTKLFAAYLAISVAGLVLIIVCTPEGAEKESSDRRPKAVAIKPLCKDQSRVWCKK